MPASIAELRAYLTRRGAEKRRANPRLANCCSRVMRYTLVAVLLYPLPTRVRDTPSLADVDTPLLSRILWRYSILGGHAMIVTNGNIFEEAARKESSKPRKKPTNRRPKETIVIKRYE